MISLLLGIFLISLAAAICIMTLEDNGVDFLRLLLTAFTFFCFTALIFCGIAFIDSGFQSMGVLQ